MDLLVFCVDTDVQPMQFHGYGESNSVENLTFLGNQVWQRSRLESVKIPGNRIVRFRSGESNLIATL